MDKSYERNILITGGAGFIGSHLVRHFVRTYPQYHIINLDMLTYAGNLENLQDISEADNYTFAKGDVCDANLVAELFRDHKIDGVIHLAAESHVDRSIKDPLAFARTNVLGTLNLLTVAKDFWKGDNERRLFYHISTDEVYGALGETGFFTERTAYDPHSPYSASKSSSDHFARAFYHTYGLPVVISNCSNNYGPYQFPEKFIPLMILNCIENRPLPVYGRGENVRDWLFVGDHVEAIDRIFHHAHIGETYAIGGNSERRNIDVVRRLCSIIDMKLHRPEGCSERLITFVPDRTGHDFRYAIDSSKIRRELGWEPKTGFEYGLEVTVDWYLEHAEWLGHVTSGAYREYGEQWYS